MVYSVGADNSPIAQANIGFATKIPASLVIRKDSKTVASEMIGVLLAMREEAEKAEAEQEADLVQEAIEAAPQAGLRPPYASTATNPQDPTLQQGVPPQNIPPTGFVVQQQAQPAANLPPLPPELSVMGEGLTGSVLPQNQERSDASNDRQ